MCMSKYSDDDIKTLIEMMFDCDSRDELDEAIGDAINSLD